VTLRGGGKEFKDGRPPLKEKAGGRERRDSAAGIAEKPAGGREKKSDERGKDLWELYEDGK